MGIAVTRRAAVAGFAVCLAGCAGRSYSSGRAPPPGRVLIFPPHVTLGERVLGGLFRLRRDWSETVRKPVLEAGALAVARRRRAPVFLADHNDAETAWSLARLHRPVAESLMDFDAALTGGRAPATRGRPGLGVAGRALAAAYDAPTGLFVSITGDYAAGWQRAAESVLAETLENPVEGIERRIIVSLVELRTGRVFWSAARRERAIRNPARAARHVVEMVQSARFRAPARA